MTSSPCFISPLRDSHTGKESTYALHLFFISLSALCCFETYRINFYLVYVGFGQMLLMLVNRGEWWGQDASKYTPSDGLTPLAC